MFVSIPHRYAKNLYSVPYNKLFSQFQFLIGTLKTRIAEEKAADRLEVSIPHRYAKNNFEETSPRKVL